MPRPITRRLLGLATVTSMQALLLGGTAGAQPVQMFEEPPPLELLRSIMIPESRPGLSRRIVLNAPDMPSALSTMRRDRPGRDSGIMMLRSSSSGGGSSNICTGCAPAVPPSSSACIEVTVARPRRRRVSGRGMVFILHIGPARWRRWRQG